PLSHIGKDCVGATEGDQSGLAEESTLLDEHTRPPEQQECGNDRGDPKKTTDDDHENRPPQRRRCEGQFAARNAPVDEVVTLCKCGTGSWRGKTCGVPVAADDS